MPKYITRSLTRRSHTFLECGKSVKVLHSITQELDMDLKYILESGENNCCYQFL